MTSEGDSFGGILSFNGVPSFVANVSGLIGWFYLDWRPRTQFLPQVVPSFYYRVLVETMFAPNLFPFLQAVVLASFYYRLCVEMMFVFFLFAFYYYYRRLWNEILIIIPCGKIGLPGTSLSIRSIDSQ